MDFVSGNRYVDNQYIKLVGESSPSLFPGQPHMGMLWDLSHSFDSDSFVEPDLNLHIWSSHLVHG